MGIMDRLKGWLKKEKAMSTLHRDYDLHYEMEQELSNLLKFELYIRGLDKEGITADIFTDEKYRQVVGIEFGEEEIDYKTGKPTGKLFIPKYSRPLHTIPKYGDAVDLIYDAEKHLKKGNRSRELYELAEELKGHEDEVKGEYTRRKIIKLFSPFIEQRAKMEFNEFLDKYLEREKRWQESENLRLLREGTGAEVKYEEHCGHCDAPVKLEDFRKGECGYCGHPVRDRIRKKIEEGKPALAEAHKGPKKTVQMTLSVVLVLCLTFGIGSLITKRLATGYTVFTDNSANWPTAILLLIPAVFALYWLRERIPQQKL